MRIDELTRTPIDQYKIAVEKLTAIISSINELESIVGWAGEAIDIINDALTLAAGDIVYMVRVRMQGNRIGGGLSVYTNDGKYAPMVTVLLPTWWIDSTLPLEKQKEKFLQEFKKNIAAIATTFSHEIGHATQFGKTTNPIKISQTVHSQYQFDENSDLEWQIKAAKYAAADDTNSDEVRVGARQFLYLTKKYEIEMQAYSAAQELFNYYEKNKAGFDDIISMLKSWNKLKDISKLDNDLPHLVQYVDFMRNGIYRSKSAYQRFLKKTVAFLREMF